MNKKLYRSNKDRVIGGVCGGLGEYFGIDPIILRLVLIILFLAGAMGFLIYIIAWILIPINPETISVASQSASGQAADNGARSGETIIDITPKQAKKLFRAKSESPDRMIGGVCFGFAKFFGVDPTWVRLGFLISILCLGFGTLIYILSWIIIPEEE